MIFRIFERVKKRHSNRQKLRRFLALDVHYVSWASVFIFRPSTLIRKTMYLKSCITDHDKKTLSDSSA